MFPHTFAKRSRRVAVAIASALAIGALLTACAGSGQSASSKSDSINYALPADFTPNWILPIGTSAHLNTNNLSIAASLWEPLVAYDGSSGTVSWNKKASLATAAVFAPDNTSVTITLGKRTWSDGTPVTSRDVEFWYNIIKANKAQWGNYNPGQAPDNWTSFTTIDSTHFRITFDKAYSPQWMLANQLSMITPMPQHAWDKTSDSGTVGNADETTQGAQQVWNFLNTEAGNISTYATNPLWKVVSGPYTISSFSTSGKVVLASNSKYDGGEKAHIDTVNLLPFTTTDAQENALRSGQVDYGYINATDLDQKSSFTAKGYSVDPWAGWAITYLPLNFNNPTMGPVFSQLYARQAIQMSVDQKTLASVVFNGTAVPTYGPVPQAQPSSFVSDTQKNNPYPFSTSAAKDLLKKNGWSEVGGVMTCQSAGTATGDCGAGIAAGTKFQINLLSQSGSTITDNMMSAIQSSLSQSGISMNIKTAPVNTVLSQTPQCTADQPICSWQLSFFGTSGSWYFPAVPTGDSLFETGGGANFGSYTNPSIDKLIAATIASSSDKAMQDYSAAAAKDLPVIWLPSPDYQISVIRNGLGGFHQDPLGNFHPAQWSWNN